jgi:hypothetical protein
MFDQACQRPAAPKVEYLMEYKGRKVIITDHVRQRARERHGMPVETMKTYFQHVIDGLDACNFKPVEYNQEIFVYSRAFQRGMVIAFRRDFKSDNQNLVLVAVTCYPYGRAVPAQADTEIYYV